MSDSINREDAIEAVEHIMRRDKIYLPHYKERRKALVNAITMIKKCPSTEAEWIPCNERLPEESGTYLTTTAKGSVCTDHFYANSNDICGRHWSYHRRREPIAWMPLPPAYREESEV